MYTYTDVSSRANGISLQSALLDGCFKYGTAFGGTKVDDIGKILMSKGFHYSGPNTLVDLLHSSI